MKRLCFIIPYFGKLPNYFSLFLKTCETNRDFNWIVFTDDMVDYGYPPNVERVGMTFDELVELLKSKFPECEVNIKNPYKLCDLKPMYGFIFEEYIKEYLYWGHCDVDAIMGDLGELLTKDFLEQYDKLFCLGHMTIYRNDYENNRVFKSSHNGESIYQKVLKSPEIMWFDEEWNNDYNINRIFISQKKRCFQEDMSFNVAVAYNKFRRIQYVGKDNTPQPNGYKLEKYRESIYLWNNGHLIRFYINDKELIKEELFYMHLQSRKMILNSDVLDKNIFKIVNDEFKKLECACINVDNFDVIKKHGKCRHKQRLFIRRVENMLQKYINGKR